MLGEQLGEAAPPPVEAGLDGADGRAGLGGDPLDREVGEVVQRHGDPLLLGEPAQGVEDGDPLGSGWVGGPLDAVPLEGALPAAVTAPVAHGEATRHRAHPGERVVGRGHPVPVGPGAGVRLLCAVLGQGQVAGRRLHEPDHPPGRASVERVELLDACWSPHVIPPSPRARTVRALTLPDAHRGVGGCTEVEPGAPGVCSRGPGPGSATLVGMTVVDRLRSALPGGEPADPATGEGDGDHGPGWQRGAVVGVLTGLVSLLLVVVPVLVAWGTAPARDPGDVVWDAVSVAASLWLVVSGAHVTAGAASIAFTPLLGAALLVVVARFGVREAMVRVRTDGEYRLGLLPHRLAEAVAGWWAGYAGVGLVAAWLAAVGPFDPEWATLAVPLVVVPLLGVLAALRPVVRADPEVLGPRLSALLPDVVRRAVGPGLVGAASLVLLGCLVVAWSLVLHWDRVAAVQDALDAGGPGSVVLLLAQVGALPNLGLWAASFLAGPGFQVVSGATVTWSGASSGLLPMVPVLGALPQPQAFPWFVPVLAVLPLVAVGVLTGRRAVRTVARLSRLRTKVAVSTLACAVAALAVGLLDALGGGSLGQFRLASLGAPALVLSLAVFGWLLLGALLAVLHDAWRLRR